jgi:formylglycine-generating enzyme required for sulfatase activity/DNA-binding NarL/FixJ family response regulator
MNILIVDDEPGLAAGLAGWLKENGWGTLGVATTSDEAVEWINRNGHVDVLVCDVAIAPADGFTLREAIQPHLPKMRTIFISAYDLSGHTARMEGCHFLPKPVTGEALDDAIRALFQPKAPKTFMPPVNAAVKATPSSNGAATPRVIAASPRAAAASKDAPRVVVAARPTRPRPTAVAGQASKPASASPKAPAPAAKAPGQAGWEVELPPDELVGSAVGNYHIGAKIEQGVQGSIYRAVQTSMGRQVRLYVLEAKLAQDPLEIERFMSNASVKANVRHPYIFAVYEAGESNGVYFYSCEYFPCRSVRWLREAGVYLDERSALQAMKVAAEVMGYFWRENITHNLLSENSVLVGPNGRPRIANIAVLEVTKRFGVAQEMQELGRIIAEVLPETSQALGVRKFARSLASGETDAFPDWSALSQKITSMEPKVAPEDAYKLEEQERAASRMVEIAKKRQRKSMLISSAVSLCLFSLALGSLWWFLFRPKGGDVRTFNRMIEIPGGEFIYQDGQKLSLPTFLIDECEVTIGQYAEFLKYLEQHPGEAAKFDHPRQPKGKSHVPAQWADQDLATGSMPGYYARAKRWGRYHDAPLDVNSPVFGVDWFDAFAYANWKGRRLPTEEEWEKAARGTQGFKYPWGNEPDVTKVNSGSDFDPNPKKGGEQDGYKRWSPVDAKKGDRSPFGVIDMAGNVSEWTASLDTDPRMPSQEIPVIRGGNWKNPDYSVTRRVLLLTEFQADDALGFRTASDGQPAKAVK